MTETDNSVVSGLRCGRTYRARGRRAECCANLRRGCALEGNAVSGGEQRVAAERAARLRGGYGSCEVSRYAELSSEVWSAEVS